MKHYLFLTTDGSTKDQAGDDIENCQMIARVTPAKSALDAYNILLETDGFCGDFDTCYCYELANNGQIQGCFDLISGQSESEDEEK